MSLELAHKVILPPKKNYIPQFLKQRDINSYYYVTRTVTNTTALVTVTNATAIQSTSHFNVPKFVNNNPVLCVPL